MYSLFADPDSSVPCIKLYGYQIYFVEEFVCNQMQIKTILTLTGNQSDEVTLYQYPTESVSYISSLPHIKKEKSDYGNIYYFDFHQIGFKVTQTSSYNIDLMHDYITLYRLGVIDKIPFSLKPINDAILFKFNHLYKLKATMGTYRYSLKNIIEFLCTSLKLLGQLESDHSFFSNTLANAFHGFCSTVVDSDYCQPKSLAYILSTIVSLKNKLQYITKDQLKDPFTDSNSFSKQLLSYQKSKELDKSGILDHKTILLIDGSFQKHKEKHLPNRIKSKLEDLSGMQQKILLHTVDSIDELLEYPLGEKLAQFWSLESMEVEGLFKGGKEFGKALIKNVQSKALIPDSDKVLSLSHPLNPLIKKRKSSGKSSEAYDPVSPSSQEPVKELKMFVNGQQHFDITELYLIPHKAKSSDQINHDFGILRPTMSYNNLDILQDTHKKQDDVILIAEMDDLFSTLTKKQKNLQSRVQLLHQLEKELVIERNGLENKCQTKKNTIEYYEKIVNTLLTLQTKLHNSTENNYTKVQQSKKEMDNFQIQLNKVDDSIEILIGKIKDNEETELSLIQFLNPTSYMTMGFNWVLSKIKTQ